MIKKSKLLPAIDPCVRIFQFFCFGDFYVPRRASAREKLEASWILIKYLTLIGIVSYQIIDSSMGRINRLKDSNGVAIHFTVITLTSTEGLTSVIQSLVTSSKSARFMKLMRKADKILVNKLNLKIDYNDLRWTLLTTMSSFLIYAAGRGYILYSITEHRPELMQIAIYYNFAVLLMLIFTHRFIFMVQLLTIYIDIMVKVLEHSISHQPVLLRKADRKTWIWNTKNNHFKVKVMQRVYGLLWEASKLINESFGVGMAYVFFVQIISVLYQGYTMCIAIAKGESNHRQIFNIFLTLSALFRIHYHSQRCLNSVIFSSVIINRNKSIHD